MPEQAIRTAGPRDRIRTALTLSPGTTLRGTAGTYRVEEEIGRGGVGVVYKLSDIDSGLSYAAKILSPHRFPLSVIEKRFRRGILIHRRLQHPNIVSLREVIKDAGSLILVSTYAPYGTLYDRLAGARRDGQQLPIATVVRWMWYIARGLGYIHSKGIVHRDLTPRNVLFPEADLPAIADFGIARRVLDPTITEPIERLGSLIYISPQQRERSHSADKRDDVFALGQVSYEIAAGLTPHGNPPVLSTVRSDFPRTLATLIDSLRSFNKDQRPSDAEAVMKELESAMLGTGRDRRLADELPLSLVFDALNSPLAQLQLGAVETLLSRGLIGGDVGINFLDKRPSNLLNLTAAVSTFEDPLQLGRLKASGAKKKIRLVVRRLRDAYDRLSSDSEQSFIASRVELFSEESHKRALAGICKVTLFRKDKREAWEAWRGYVRDLSKSGVGTFLPVDETVDIRSFVATQESKSKSDLIGRNLAWLVNRHSCARLVSVYWGDSVVVRDAYAESVTAPFIGAGGATAAVHDAMQQFLALFDLVPFVNKWCPVKADHISALLDQIDDLLREYDGACRMSADDG